MWKFLKTNFLSAWFVHLLSLLMLCGMMPAHAQYAATILSIKPTTCLQPKDQLSIAGVGFDKEPQKRKIVIANKEGEQSTLKISQWGDQKIVVVIPTFNTDQLGQVYRLGVVEGSRWISNRNITLKLCSPKVVLTPRLVLTPKQPAPLPIKGTVIEPSGDDSKTDDGQSAIDVRSESVDTPVNDDSPFQSASPVRHYGSLQSLGPPPVNQIEVEVDEKISAEPKEVVVISASLEEAQRLAKSLSAYAIKIKRRNNYPSLNLVVSVLRVPESVSPSELVATLRENDPNLWVDLNHQFQLMADDKPQRSDPKQWAYDAIEWPENYRHCLQPQKLGLIDTGISQKKVINQRQIVHQSFLSAGIKAADESHATAIASLILGSPKYSIAGLSENTLLYSAAIFRQQDKKTVNTTAELIIKAFAWLAEEDVRVINLSFGGPRNLLVEAVINQLVNRGFIIVAAAGVDRKARSLYPAAQENVVAVQGVDANANIYSKKVTGNYIDLSAPGVDLWLMSAKGKPRYFSGSSFAAPIVARLLLALQLNANENNVLDTLLSYAVDAGVEGFDESYGWGMVKTPNNLCEAQ